MDNDCSDGPLQMALNNYLIEFNKDLRLVKGGLFLTITSVLIIISAFAAICWKERKSLSCKKKKIAPDERNIVGDGATDRKISLETM